VSVCLAFCPVGGSRLSIHICRQRHSAAASGQRQCCDLRRIDADAFLEEVQMIKAENLLTVVFVCPCNRLLLLAVVMLVVMVTVTSRHVVPGACVAR